MSNEHDGRIMYTCQGYADAPEVTFVEKPEEPRLSDKALVKEILIYSAERWLAKELEGK